MTSKFESYTYNYTYQIMHACSFSLMHQLTLGSEVPVIALCMNGPTGSTWCPYSIMSQTTTYVAPYNSSAIYSILQSHSTIWNANVPIIYIFIQLQVAIFNIMTYIIIHSYLNYTCFILRNI